MSDIAGRQADAPMSDMLTPSMIREGERVFANWYAENWSLIHDNGSSGDTHKLFAELWASWKKAVYSSPVIPSAAISLPARSEHSSAAARNLLTS